MGEHAVRAALQRCFDCSDADDEDAAHEIHHPGGARSARLGVAGRGTTAGPDRPCGLRSRKACAAPEGERGHGRRRRHLAEGPADQPRSALVRHHRRDRRRAGSGAVVLPGRWRRGHGGEVDVGLRHGGERRHLRQVRPLRLHGPAAGDARPRVPAQHRSARGRTRRRDRVLRLRRHGGGPQLPGRERVPRVDGREVPVPSPRRAEPDRRPRPDARQRGAAAAGGPGRRRCEPPACRLLPAPRARAHRREPAGPTDHRTHRDRHDRDEGHRVPVGRQPAAGAQARAGGVERRRDVRTGPSGPAAE